MSRNWTTFILPLAMLAAGCTVYALPDGSTGTTSSSTSSTASTNNGINPIVLGFTTNPTAVAHPSDVMTFTITANSPDNTQLDYHWSATEGILSGTTGQMIEWYPKNTDGSALPNGLATVQVLVTDPTTGGSTVAAANIMVDNGAATVDATSSYAPSPAPSSSPSPSPSPTSSPSPSPSPSGH